MNVTIKTPAEQDKMRVAGRLAADVLDMIGVPSRKRRDWYSYNEISAQREALERNAMQAGQREKRDLLDNQVLGLWRRRIDLCSQGVQVWLGRYYHQRQTGRVRD